MARANGEANGGAGFPLGRQSVASSAWPRATPVGGAGGGGWCGRRDSNPHAARRSDLNRVRLPIPPRPQRERLYNGAGQDRQAQR